VSSTIAILAVPTVNLATRSLEMSDAMVIVGLSMECDFGRHCSAIAMRTQKMNGTNCMSDSNVTDGSDAQSETQDLYISDAGI
jgi:hypothetical protein